MLPVARNDGLRVEQLSDELIVYDVDRHKAHCLSPAAAVVWKNCDGQKTAQELAARLQEAGVAADQEMVWMILHRLSKLDLLQQRVVVPEDAFRSTRRDLMKKVAMAGGVLFLLTASIPAPAAKKAASGGVRRLR